MSNLYIEHQLGAAPLIAPGTRVGRFTIQRMLSVGGFGQVFEAIIEHTATPLPVVVKIESTSAKFQLLYNETSCLRSLNAAYPGGGTPFLKFYEYDVTDTFRYVAMEKCGMNLRDLKRNMALNRFGVPTSLWIMRKMTEALQMMHNIGWLHRDVKPANFCIGLNSPRALFVLDFGMSRCFVAEDGSLKPRQITAPFHGTLRYVSVNIHRKQDASRWDDLWSVFYICIENMVGFLPWRRLGDINIVASTKLAADLTVLRYGQETRQPHCLATWHRYLNMSLNDESFFYKPPPYQLFLNEIDADLQTRKVTMSTVTLDWTRVQYSPTSAYTKTIGKPVYAAENAPAGAPKTRQQQHFGGDRSVYIY